MKSISGTAVVAGFVASLVLVPVAGHAEMMKKNHRAARVSQTVPAQPEYRGVYDPSGGNAAVGGNNANSMDGSNSAVNNANGRTSGGGHG
jgi:hypothetical protein